MTEETEETRFRYMLEFPNKIKIYCADEQLFSNLLERYCAVISAVPTQCNSAPAKQKENQRIVNSLSTSRCPDCGSNRITFDNEHNDVLCVNCGFVFPPQKQMETSQDMDREENVGYDVLQNEKGYLIVCKSNKATHTQSVSKCLVDEVCLFLKSQKKSLSVTEIEVALKISNVSIYNALKVLRFQEKADVEVSHYGYGGGKRFLYKAAQTGDSQQKLLPT